MHQRIRKTGLSGYYHVIARGNGKQIIFEEEKDYRYFLRLLEKYSKETAIQICAYCLMENHVHILLCDTGKMCSLFMQKLEITYAWYYNHKYERSGHLFQGRYLREVVDQQEYLLGVFRYILKNPEKAGICKASEYKWNSYYSYGKKDSFLYTDLLEALIGDWEEYTTFICAEKEKGKAGKESREDDSFVDKKEFLEYDRCTNRHQDNSRHDDEWAKKLIQDIFCVRSGTEIRTMEKTKRDAAIRELKKRGLSFRQIERLTGVGLGIISRA